MSGPITPHVTVQTIPDGIRLTVKHSSIVLPPDMAKEIGNWLISSADAHDPLTVPEIPVVTPTGKSIA